MNLGRSVVVFALIVLGFQNCVPSSKIAFSNKPSLSKAPEAASETEGGGGDGHPYDGKVFVLRGDVCPDQSDVRSKILLKSLSSASLIRENCKDITPLVLTSADFQLNPVNSEQLIYKGDLFLSVKPSQVIGTQLDLTSLEPNGGFAYMLSGSFGGPIDINASIDVSKLRLYEDGVLIGPAHAYHWEIRDIGRGHYSHWDDSLGVDRLNNETLRFSASDNSDPRTNGRVYSFDLGGN